MTIIYAIAASGLHFRLYNQALKPTLLELVALFLIVAFLHLSSAYFYYINFSSFSKRKPVNITADHNLVRHFNDYIFWCLLLWKSKVIKIIAIFLFDCLDYPKLKLIIICFFSLQVYRSLELLLHPHSTLFTHKQSIFYLRQGSPISKFNLFCRFTSNREWFSSIRLFIIAKFLRILLIWSIQCHYKCKFRRGLI